MIDSPTLRRCSRRAAARVCVSQRNALHACQAGSPLIWKTLSAPAPRKPKIRPGVYTVGGRDEAWIYRQAYLGYWQHAGALAWATGAQPGPARGGEC